MNRLQQQLNRVLNFVMVHGSASDKFAATEIKDAMTPHNEALSAMSMGAEMDEILRLAKGCGAAQEVAKFTPGETLHVFTSPALENFARKIRESEREACAKACEDKISFDMDDPGATCAQVIRSRTTP